MNLAAMNRPTPFAPDSWNAHTAIAVPYAQSPSSEPPNASWMRRRLGFRSTLRNDSLALSLVSAMFPLGCGTHAPGAGF